MASNELVRVCCVLPMLHHDREGTGRSREVVQGCQTPGQTLKFVVAMIGHLHLKPITLLLRRVVSVAESRSGPHDRLGTGNVMSLRFMLWPGL